MSQKFTAWQRSDHTDMKLCHHTKPVFQMLDAENGACALYGFRVLLANNWHSTCSLQGVQKNGIACMHHFLVLNIWKSSFRVRPRTFRLPLTYWTILFPFLEWILYIFFKRIFQGQDTTAFADLLKIFLVLGIYRKSIHSKCIERAKFTNRPISNNCSLQ